MPGKHAKVHISLLYSAKVIKLHYGYWGTIIVAEGGEEGLRAKTDEASRCYNSTTRSAYASTRQLEAQLAGDLPIRESGCILITPAI